MGKKIRLKRKSTIAVLSILACLVGLASWMAAFYHTNHLPYQIPDKIYQAGDFVPVGNNYFISPDENPDGYSVQVNDAKLLTYQQLPADRSQLGAANPGSYTALQFPL